MGVHPEAFDVRDAHLDVGGCSHKRLTRDRVPGYCAPLVEMISRARAQHWDTHSSTWLHG